jgi:hypothetical protein
MQRARVKERRGKGQEKGQERVTAAREKLSPDQYIIEFQFVGLAEEKLLINRLIDLFLLGSSRLTNNNYKRNYYSLDDIDPGELSQLSNIKVFIAKNEK